MLPWTPAGIRGPPVATRGTCQRQQSVPGTECRITFLGLSIPGTVLAQGEPEVSSLPEEVDEEEYRMPYYTVDLARAKFLEELYRLRSSAFRELSSWIRTLMKEDPSFELHRLIHKQREADAGNGGGASVDRSTIPISAVFGDGQEVDFVPSRELEKLIGTTVETWSSRWNLQTGWIVAWAKSAALSRSSILSFPDCSEMSPQMPLGTDVQWWNQFLRCREDPCIMRLEVPWRAGWFPMFEEPSDAVLAQIHAVEGGARNNAAEGLLMKATPEQETPLVDEALRRRLRACAAGIGSVTEETLGTMASALLTDLSAEQRVSLAEEALQARVEGLFLQPGIVPNLQTLDPVQDEQSPNRPRWGEDKTRAEKRLKPLAVSQMQKMVTSYLNEEAARIGPAKKFKAESFGWLVCRLVPREAETRVESWTSIESAAKSTRKTIRKHVPLLAEYLELDMPHE